MNLMTNYEILNLADSKKWGEYLKRLPIEQQDIYFTPEYYRLYEELGDGKAMCFVFSKDNNIALYPFLLNSVNDLGYDLDKKYFDIQGAYGYNGVISSSYNPEFINAFYRGFDCWCRKTNVIAEFTRFHPLINNQSFSKSHLQVVFDRKTIYIDLKNGYEHILRNFHKDTRRRIRKAADRYHVEVKCFGNGNTQLDALTSIYRENMDRVQSIPYLYFNKTYFKFLIENTQNICFAACREKKIIAFIIAFYNQYYLHAHLGGTLTDYLKISPYSLLFSEMVKFGQSKGCSFLHLGGGVTTKKDDSLLRFKMNFSDTTADFFIGKKVHDEFTYNEVVKQWQNKYPEKIEPCKNLLLKYRY